MLDRVAKAISDECAGADPRDMEAFVAAAFAAIDTMLKLTRKMQDAGERVIDTTWGRVGSEDIWRAMIDAALAEDEP
jgi:HJR/Mrr/RecB family endonuclease